MGVVYRLTPEISAYIISEKQKDPKATCQNLSGRVFLQFGQQVSKSSVHALLKQSHVITPRERKIKDTFKIPVEKKAEISKALAPFIPTIELVDSKSFELKNAPQPPLLERGGVNISVEESPTPSLFKEGVGGVCSKELMPAMGKIFLNAALWDLSFKSILGINDVSDLANFNDSQIRTDWAYLTQEMQAIKIETEAGHFYIDPRFQGLYRQNPANEHLGASVEKTIGQVTDKILNNIEPLLIGKMQSEDVYSFLDAFENRSGKAIKRISVIGSKNREFIDFKHPLSMKRRFMIGISLKHEELQWFANGDLQECSWPDKELAVKAVKYDDICIITNMLSMSYDEIKEKYDQQCPQGTSLELNLEAKSDDNQEEQWLDLWVENKLKARAITFFPSGFEIGSLNQLLLLEGREDIKDTQRDVYLQVPEFYEHKKELMKAIENIHRCGIKDFKARKLRIYVG